MKKLNWIFILLCGMFFTACSDFLEEKSQDEVLIKTAKEFEGILLYYTDRQSSWNVLDMVADDIEAQTSKLNNQYNASSMINYCFKVYTWQPDVWDASWINNAYTYTYNNIKGVNAVLDAIDEAEGSIEEKELVKARAFALRGYYYLMLVNVFGEPYNLNKNGLGVVMKRTATVAENGIARSTVEECYNYIISDFKEAITLFKKYPKTKNQFLNITATNILLSRAYLYMENWEEAAKAATEAINTSDGLSNFTGLSSVILGSYDTKEVEWVTNITYYSLWSTYFYVATDLRTSYESGDQRKSFWINSNNTIKKLSTKGNYQNYQSLRIAEAYLNRAEAYAKSNNDQGALADLNELRRNRITDYQNENLSGEALKDAIRAERRKELCFEGLRWFDLRRYGMPAISREFKDDPKGSLKTYTLQEKDPFYILPIPSVAFDNNPLLKQNTLFNNGEPREADGV